MADSGWGCKSNGANPRWGCKSNFDGAVSPMGRYVHTNWGAQYRGAVSPASNHSISLTLAQYDSDSLWWLISDLTLQLRDADCIMAEIRVVMLLILTHYA